MSSEDEAPSGNALATPWARGARHALDSYVAANNAVYAAMGLASTDAGSDGSDVTDSPDRSAEGGKPVAEGVAADDEEWTMVRSTADRSELGVGEYVRFSKPVRDDDVAAFASVSGDTNRLHLDEAFADESRFSGRIAHGTLVAGTISAALARLPGTTIYLSQDLEFRAPVEIGTTVTAEVEIAEALGDDQYRVLTTVEDEDGELVIDGEAVVLVGELPAE